MGTRKLVWSGRLRLPFASIACSPENLSLVPAIFSIVVSRGVAAIGYHLSRLFLQPLFDAIHRRQATACCRCPSASPPRPRSVRAPHPRKFARYSLAIITPSEWCITRACGSLVFTRAYALRAFLRCYRPATFATLPARSPAALVVRVALAPALALAFGLASSIRGSPISPRVPRPLLVLSNRLPENRRLSPVLIFVPAYIMSA